jgi:DNA replication and repair protein RecF
VHLTRLALTDFRCYQAADIEFEPGVTTFTGPNGAGKTNLIEAAGYVATFGSHRVSADGAMVRAGADRAILRAAVTSAARDSLVEIELNPSRANRVRLNRVALSKPRDALGALRCVLFAPEDLAIVKGDPDQRRRYLDELLVASRPRYAAVRSDYERVLKQRTALLKSARATGRGQPAGLEIWDEQLITKGAELTAGRLRLLAGLRPLMTAAYADVSADPRGVSMTYRLGSGSRSIPALAAAPGTPALGTAAGTALAATPGRAGGQARVTAPAGPGGLSGPDAPGHAREQTAAIVAELAESIRAGIERVRRAELERGVCLIGPHRDELELRIGELPARGYASHGESWSLALALRLAAFGLLRSDGEDPVLMLDDVFAELDVGRRDRLAELASAAEQVLVTAAVPADVPARLVGAGYTVVDGVISRAS